jgi:hypothetical protein
MNLSSYSRFNILFIYLAVAVVYVSITSKFTVAIGVFLFFSAFVQSKFLQFSRITALNIILIYYIGTLFLNVGEFERKVLLIAPLLFLIFKRSDTLVTARRRIILYSAGLTVALQVVSGLLEKFKVQLISFVMAGYDNSHHFAIFQNMLKTDRISRFSQSTQWEIPSFFAYQYPPGNSIFWQSVLAPLRLNGSDVYFSMYLFLATILLSVFSLIILTFKIVGYLTNESRSKVQIIHFAFVTIAISLGTFSFMISSGFPTVLTGLGLALYIFNVSYVEFPEYSRISFVTQLAIIVLISNTYVTLMPSVFLCFLYLLHKQRSSSEPANSQNDTRFVVSVLILTVSLIFVLFRFTAGTMGWRQILEPGGIQPIPNSILLLTTVTLIVFIAKYKFRNNAHKYFSVFVGTNLMVCIALSCLTFIYNGSISYYAMKQWYVCVLLCIPCLISLLHSRNLFSKVPILVLACIFTMLQYSNVKNPSVFRYGFMSSTYLATKYSIDPNLRVNLPVNASQLIAAHSVSNESPYAVVLDPGGYSDLASRWLNTLNHNWTDSNWFFYTPPDSWNLDDLRLESGNKSTKPAYLITDNEKNINSKLFDLLKAAGVEVRIISRS